MTWINIVNFFYSAYNLHTENADTQVLHIQKGTYKSYTHKGTHKSYTHRGVGDKFSYVSNVESLNTSRMSKTKKCNNSPLISTNNRTTIDLVLNHDHC